MKIFIYGEDTYSSELYLDKLIEQFKQKHDPEGRAVVLLAADESEAAAMIGHIAGSGLFSEKKLVVVKNLFAKKEPREALEEFLAAAAVGPDTTLVVYERGKLDKRLGLVKKLLKSEVAKEFAAPAPEAVEGFIANIFSKGSKEADREALAILAAAVGADYRRAKSEALKYTRLPETRITSALVRAHSRTETQAEIWALMDALSGGNKRIVLKLLETQLAAGVPPLYILSMLIRQTRLLLALHKAVGDDRSLAAELSLHPFVVKKTRQQAGAFSEAKLVVLFQALARLDTALKSGRGDAKVLFTVLADSITK